MLSIFCALSLAACGGGGDGGIDDPVGGGEEIGHPNLSFKTFSPQETVPGTLITIEAEGLTKATRVFLGATEIPATMQSTEVLTITAPPNATDQDISSPIVLRREDNAEATSAASLVIRAIPDAEEISVPEARVGESVRVSGQRLQLIDKIYMGDAEAPLSNVSTDGTWLDFIVPDNAASGSVVMIDKNGFRHSSLTLQVIGTAVDLHIQDVQIGQAHLISVMPGGKKVRSPYLRLVPLKDTIVRIRLLPNADNTYRRPQVRLRVSNTDMGTRTFPMEGPAVLPANPVADDDLENSYTFTVPGEWIGPGFRIDIEANEQAFPTTVTRFAFEPTSEELGVATYMRMHFVLQSNNAGGSDVRMEVVEKFKQEIQARYPVSVIDFVEEPNLARNPGDTSNDWYRALNDYRNSRPAEQRTNYDFHFGVMACNGCTGLGGGRVAVGSHLWYTQESYAYQGVLMHELGHNLGRPHSFSDADFPYDEGTRLGGPWAINLMQNREMTDPSTWHDVMSYSYPKTVSDYTYSKVHDYMQAQLPLSGRPSASKTSKRAVERPVLYLSGSIMTATGKVQLNPISPMQSQADTLALPLPAQTSGYILELITASGTLRYPLQPETLHDADEPTETFDLKIPVVQDIKTMHVYRDGVRLDAF